MILLECQTSQHCESFEYLLNVISSVIKFFNIMQSARVFVRGFNLFTFNLNLIAYLATATGFVD